MVKVFYVVAAFALLGLASCGNKKTDLANAQEDSAIAFVQSELKDEIIQELDSLLNEISACKSPSFVKSGTSTLTLTDEEKKVKPEYLVDPKNAVNASNLSEKYRILTVLRLDRNIAELYDMDTTEYDIAISKLLSDINDPAFKASFDDTKKDKAEIESLYAAEKEVGRINYVWECIATTNVESLYILSKNVDKLTSTLDDETVANISKRLSHILISVNTLDDYDSDFKPVSESLNLLKDIKATTVVDLRKQLDEQKSNIENARKLLIQALVANNIK